MNWNLFIPNILLRREKKLREPCWLFISLILIKADKALRLFRLFNNGVQCRNKLIYRTRNNIIMRVLSYLLFNDLLHGQSIRQ